MTYQVSEADLKTIRLNEQDTVSSVLHNVALILATPKGTVPMYRDCSVGTYLYSKLPSKDIHTLIFKEEMSKAHADYLGKMEFIKENGVYVKTIN